MLGRLRDVLLRLVVLVEKAARLHELGSLALAQALHEAGAELFQGEVVLQIFSRVRHARALLRQIGRHSSERLAVRGARRTGFSRSCSVFAPLALGIHRKLPALSGKGRSTLLAKWL